MAVTITAPARGIIPRALRAAKYGSFAAARGMIMREISGLPIVDGVIPDGSPSTAFAVQETLDSYGAFSIMTTSENTMNNRWTARLFIVLIIVFLSGCATAPPSPPSHQTARYFWFCEPSRREIHTDHYDVRLVPRCSYWGCPSFDFYIRNKTGRELKIDWNKTRYLKNGKPAGNFMFRGIVFKDVYGKKLSNVVASLVDYSTVLYPNDLVFYDDQWRHRPMEPGESGIDLFVRANNQDFHEQLSMQLSLELKSPEDPRTPCKDFSRPDATLHDWAGISVIDTHMGVGVVDILHMRSPAKNKVWEGDIIKAVNNKIVKDKYAYLKSMHGLDKSPSPTQLLLQREEKEILITVSVTVSIHDLPKIRRTM